MNLQSTPTGWDLPQLRTWLGTQFASIVQGWSKDHRADGGHSAIHEYGRVTPLGVAIAIPYLEGSFTASGAQTWTVGTADQVSLFYTLIGKIMTVHFELANTTVGGVADAQLRIALPTGEQGHRYRATRRTNGTHSYSDNGTAGNGLVRILAGETFIRLFLVNLGNWAAAANTTSVRGQFSCEVETF